MKRISASGPPGNSGCFSSGLKLFVSSSFPPTFEFEMTGSTGFTISSFGFPSVVELATCFPLRSSILATVVFTSGFIYGW
jgi:hypothetical protein